VGYWDPFLVGHFLPRFTHFVSSDRAFKHRIPGFFLPRLGVIPIRKNERDIQVIRDISEVIRQGENVGIFPEAVRNWSGVTQPIDSSIAKLVKFLKVPVVIAVMRGMNQFNPRWSARLRRTHVEIEYKFLLSGDRTQEISTDEIFNMVSTALYHDEVEFQQENRHRIHSNHKAQWISHALFVCPECHSIDSFHCSGDDFACSNCSYGIQIDDYGFFNLKKGHQLRFDNIRDWYDWQEKWLIDFVSKKHLESCKDVIFKDHDSKVHIASKDEPFQFIGRANVLLYVDRIELDFTETNQLKKLLFRDLQTVNPQINENVEIKMGDQMYRLEGREPGVSGLKWELAANAIWKMFGQMNKRSPYIRF
jgi:hypothetical protein